MSRRLSTSNNVDRKTKSFKLLRIIDQITFVINLNYILVESQREDYTIFLDSGKINKNKIVWLNNKTYLSPSYDISYSSMFDYLSTNHDKIIKISSIDNRFPDREIKTIVIYFPDPIDLNVIKKSYNVVDIDL